MKCAFPSQLNTGNLEFLSWYNYFVRHTACVILSLYNFPVGFLYKKFLLSDLILSVPCRRVRMQSCNVNNIDFCCVGLVQSSLYFYHIHKMDCEAYDTKSHFLKLVDKILQTVVMFSQGTFISIH